jgi:hypothetical protein
VAQELGERRGVALGIADLDGAVDDLEDGRGGLVAPVGIAGGYPADRPLTGRT